MQLSDFYCTSCGNKTYSLPRKNSKQRPPGHLKKLFCLKCQREVNCVEIRAVGSKYTLETFRWEFENNNFDKEGNRVVPYTQLNKKIREERRNENV